MPYLCIPEPIWSSPNYFGGRISDLQRQYMDKQTDTLAPALSTDSQIINALSLQEKTCLWLVILFSHPEMTAVQLRNVNYSRLNIPSMLIYQAAAAAGHLATIAMSAPENDEQMALIAAAEHGQLAVVNCLLGRNVSIERSRYRAFALAVENGHTEIVRSIMQHATCNAHTT